MTDMPQRQAAISCRPGSRLEWKGQERKVVANDTLNRILTLDDGTKLRYKPGTEIITTSRPFRKA